MNDEQWQQMQRYYLSSIDTGIYVAPRGPNNTWNLHFDDDAQAFYGQLLRDLRLYGNVDPDRIYLLGYSAGGDGVYQLAPRFASQLAAASMSAGHHNGVPADNLMHVPMLLQVGELDDAYDRNKETVRYGMILDSLQKRFLGEFVHQVYVHAQAEHSYVLDRRGPTFLANVCADPIAWLHGAKAAATRQAITDAPTWLAHHRRDPYPRYLRWDTGTRTAGGNDFYWISVERPAAGQLVEVWADPVHAEHEIGHNEIVVAAFKGALDIHLHEKLFNPQQAVTIKVAGQTFVVPPKPSMLAMAVGMARTGDPAFAFYQTMRIVGDGQKHYRLE
jgi:dienelactone hydrolase